jgi:hypothetical protein
MPGIRGDAGGSRNRVARRPVKILVDAQMSPALAAWLRAHGHDAQAVREVGLREANAALRAWLEPRLPGIVQLVAQGSRLVEVI